MGGGTVMMASGEKLPANVKSIVEDCGYSTVWDQFTNNLQIMKIPPKMILPSADLINKVRRGWSFKEASSIEQVKKCTRPILFIHGAQDTFVPANMIEKVYAAANEPKEKLVVDGAEHGASASVLGDEYWERVFKFIDKYAASNVKLNND
jgi:fermentation-respiration switch protein FrsA (DUF1100 family)